MRQYDAIFLLLSNGICVIDDSKVINKLKEKNMVEATAYQHADRRQFTSSDNSPLGTGGAGVGIVTLQLRELLLVSIRLP